MSWAEYLLILGVSAALAFLLGLAVTLLHVASARFRPRPTGFTLSRADHRAAARRLERLCRKGGDHG